MMNRKYIGIKNRLLPMLIIVNDNKFGKESIMLTIPSAAEQLFVQFSPAFTQPTFQRILPLAVEAIIVSFPGQAGRCGRWVRLWQVRFFVLFLLTNRFWFPWTTPQLSTEESMSMARALSS